MSDIKHDSISDRDADLPLFQLGQRVRLKRDVRNDGTYAFTKIGEYLAYAGEEGYIRHMGSFLQVIRVYDVDFFESGRLIGCREDELESAEPLDAEVASELAYLKAHRDRKAKS